jgi:excisionase family DNA binding protein
MADDGRNRRAPFEGEQLVGVPQVARELGIGVRLVQRAIEDGRLPAYRVGTQRRVKVRDVSVWLDGCRERRR